MAFVDKLKEKMRNTKNYEDDDEFDIADAIRKDPKYAQPLNKLRDLTIKRDEILRALRNVELDIDACLVLISYRKEKEEIGNAEEN